MYKRRGLLGLSERIGIEKIQTFFFMILPISEGALRFFQLILQL